MACLVLKFSTGQVALLNVAVFVAKDGIACGDILVGLPISRHPCIDSRTFLERRWQDLTKTDGAGVDFRVRHSPAGCIRLLMAARLKICDAPPTSPLDHDQSREDYVAHQAYVDLFLDPFLLQTEESESYDAKEQASIVAMLRKTK